MNLLPLPVCGVPVGVASHPLTVTVFSVVLQAVTVITRTTSVDVRNNVEVDTGSFGIENDV